MICYVVGHHYSFENFAQGILSSDSLKLVVPIDTGHVEAALVHIKGMADTLHQVAKVEAPKAMDGHPLLVLTTTVDREYMFCLSKMASINYFWTRPSPEAETQTFTKLLKLRDTVGRRHLQNYDRLVPRAIKVSPNLVKVADSIFSRPRPKPTEFERRSFEYPSRAIENKTEIPIRSWFNDLFTTASSTTTTSTTTATTTTTPTTTTTTPTTTTTTPTTTTTQRPPISHPAIDDLFTSPDTPPFMTEEPKPLDWSDFYGLTDNMTVDTQLQRLEINPYQVSTKVTRSDSLPDRITLNRHPRQFVTGLLVSLATSIGIGSVFGAIDNSQISQIRESLKDVSEKEKLIVHQLDIDSKYINVNRKLIQNVANLAKKLKQYTELNHFELQGAVLYMLIHAEFTQVHRELDTMINIISSAHANQFHPEVFTPDGAEAVFSDIQGLALKHGLQPVIQSARQLSQLEAHFFIQPESGSKGQASLIIDCPLASEINLFDLHRYDALPISIGQFVHATIEPKNSILAIGGMEPTGHPRFVEMSSTDLGLCRRLGKVYICPNLRIINRPNERSCLYALYRSDHRAARKACKLKLQAQQFNQAVPISSDTFLHYSSEPSSYFIRCTNGTVLSGYQLVNITRIEVPHDCVVETSEYILLRQNDLYKNEKRKTYKFSYDPLTFLPNDTTIRGLDDAAKFIATLPGAPPLSTETIDQLREMNKTVLDNPGQLTAIILAIIATLLTTGLILFLVYRAVQHRNQARLARNPMFRLERVLNESDTSVEVLEGLLKQQGNKSS